MTEQAISPSVTAQPIIPSVTTPAISPLRQRKTTLKITNRAGAEVKVYLTLGAVAGCVQDVSVIPLVTDPVNSLQCWFLLPDGATKAYAPPQGQGISGNFCFGSPPLNCPFWRVLEVAGPLAFEALHRARADAASDCIRAKARPLIYGYGGAAAGAGAIPVPVVGVGGLAGALALMLRVLAQRYGLEWTPGTFGRFTGAIGGGTLLWWGLRYGLREALKFIPVIGFAAAGGLNAAAAFAVTVGIGEAACVWLGYQRRGQTAPDDAVRRAFAEGLAIGLRRAKNKSALPRGGA